MFLWELPQTSVLESIFSLPAHIVQVHVEHGPNNFEHIGKLLLELQWGLHKVFSDYREEFHKIGFAIIPKIVGIGQLGRKGFRIVQFLDLGQPFLKSFGLERRFAERFDHKGMGNLMDTQVHIVVGNAKTIL